ncbi:hypothetical protein COY52_02900 [Candidatus Desantisbacteria bacterium CG_4_10_14_0_8_um_filter_48_22]|uniref:ADP,ATP carrier protein n=1 Tax=Candidatus Desantisbacteria bacterium CG_4_10_14_0_8_um_filter_48_22 TaxID=1974543 RepID=A0A2M7SE79_9BACT|nr:MAG: hypothetical protein AUJ67_02355 [Candidatus Desantisbacteria bacterium CG1_02_49_89]PIV57448.1 MAG: hypothetical protein COS16_00175 [Candidatus Desantisbacteria bacterium CG02_land_8_20_14_3_00_49_13]PIZ17770.1 MAG: hypothetical protein COY52_02900 [Candidatus Desantisbacteria bacterium CG_4_10_14_0_8_um_filter_48_22]
MNFLKKGLGFLKDYPLRVFQIHERDWKKLFYLSILNFIMMLGSTVGMSVATSLFLKNVGVSSLPSIYIMNGLLIAAGSFLYFPFISRFKQTTILKNTFLVLAFSILVARLGIALHFKWFYTVLYLAAIFFVWIYYTQFWTLATRICNIREGKRVFAFVVSAGLIGGGTGGVLTRAIAPLTSPNNLVLLWSFSFFAIAFVMKYTQGFLIAGTEEKTARQARAETVLGSFGRMLAQFRRSRLLVAIGLSFLFFIAATTILDFQFNTELNRAFPSETGLAVYYGSYYGYFYAATLVLVLLVVSKLIKTMGVGNAMLVMPVTIGAGFLLLNFHRGFMPVVAVRFLRDAIGGSLFESAYPLIFLPLAEEARREALTFNEGFIVPAGMLAAGVFIFFFGRSAGTSGLIITGTILCAGWIYYSFRVKENYMKSFIQSIEDRSYFERTDYLNEISHLGTGRSMDVLKTALYDENEKVSLFAMEMLCKIRKKQSTDIILDFLKDENSDPRRRASAILALGNTADFTGVFDIIPFVNSRDPRIRANAVEAIGRFDPTIARDIAEPLLVDENPRVRTNAAVIFWKYGNREKGLSVLSKMMKDADPENRVRTLYALSELGGTEILPLMEQMVDDPDDEVRLYTVRAFEKIGGLKSAQLLIRILGDKNRVVRREASRALEKMDVTVSRLLLDSMKGGSSLARKELSFILIKRNDSGTLPAIIDYCTHEIRLIYENIFYLNILSRSEELARGGSGTRAEVFSLILHSINMRNERKLFKVLRLMSAFEKSHAFTVAVRRLRDYRNHEARANAIEIIEGIAGSKIVNLLLPLIDDTTLHEKAAEAKRLWDFAEMTDTDIIIKMGLRHAFGEGEGELQGLRLCAAYLLEGL